jgi:hypothetical protein
MKEFLKSLVPGVDRHLKNLRAACGNRLCQNTQLMRSIPGSRPGVSVGQAWYCCIDCFAAASCTILERLCGLKVMEIPRNPRLSLGLFLLSKGMLTAEQLRDATAKSHCLDEDIEVTLIKLGLVGEKQLAAARSAQWGYPMLAPGFVGQMVEIDIPRAILSACKVVPLHYSATAKRIVLGFGRRVEHSLIELIEEMTQCRVEPCIITPTDFEEQMERLSTPPDYEEVVVDDPGLPEKMARTVGRAAVQVAAREASFAQWRDFVLVRVSGKRGKVDVVFHLSRNAGSGIGQQSATFKEAIAV